MASTHGLRHLERPAENCGRSKHVRGRNLIAAVSLLVAGSIAALAAVFSAGGNEPAPRTLVHEELGSADRSTALGTYTRGVDRHRRLRDRTWNFGFSRKVKLTSSLELRTPSPEWSPA
jgi:hypothetical protein